ncbi:MAG: hypothetical protein MMC23_002455 [Stictis urceolatum]|nr:hypothetical protein [Stictis urceolata]
MHLSALLLTAALGTPLLASAAECDFNALLDCIESPSDPPCAQLSCACSEVSAQSSCYKSICASVPAEVSYAVSLCSNSGAPFAGGAGPLTNSAAFPSPLTGELGTLTSALESAPFASATGSGFGVGSGMETGSATASATGSETDLSVTGPLPTTSVQRSAPTPEIGDGSTGMGQGSVQSGGSTTTPAPTTANARSTGPGQGRGSTSTSTAGGSSLVFSASGFLAVFLGVLVGV